MSAWFRREVAEAGRCDLCGGPVSVTAQCLPDSRMSCGVCAQTAVTTETTLHVIEAQVCTWMALALGMRLGLRPWATVELVGRDELRRLARAHDVAGVQDPAGLMLSQWRVAGGRRQPVELRVLVASHYPARRVWVILAHELTHLWQAEHFPLAPRDPLWDEGLATWVEHEACLATGDRPEAQRLLDSHHPVYGEGLRRVGRLQRGHPRHLVPALVAREQARR